MALKWQALILMVLLSLSPFSVADEEPEMVVYWGQNGGEGSLASTCESGNFKKVLLSFLDTFGCNRAPVLNLYGHCTGISCRSLQSEIEYCHRKKVQVFLSLGGPTGSYSLCSPNDAKVVARYLYGNFLNVQSDPLGSVNLDGINLHIQTGSDLYWENLVEELYKIRKEKKEDFLIAASPKCFLPDPLLDNAIKTGYLDSIFVQFYNDDTCQYAGNAMDLLTTWNAWTSNVPENTKVFLGIPASPRTPGYIPPENLKDVLPKINEDPKFGGVSLWDRYADVLNHYSDQLVKRYGPHLQPTKDSLHGTY